MKNPKFKVGDNAYVLKFYSMIPTVEIHFEANIQLLKVHITKIDRKGVEGFHFERYGHIMANYPHMESKIYTKKNKKKGKEIPWEKHDSVALLNVYDMKNLLTLEEAKLKMIQYIANDFNDEHSVCIGCTHGQDESY